MKPWQDQRTIRAFKRLDGDRRLSIGFDLTKAALEILIWGIRHRRPHITERQLFKEIENLLWQVTPYNIRQY